MKTLLILRHAKSSWKDDSLADHERPLNKRGQKDAARMGELLRTEGLQPDLILCSSAVRASETARLAIEASGYASEIEYRDDLYAFEPGAYLNALLKLADTCDMVMLIGHNPALEELLNGLSGDYHSLSTAALAHVELPTEVWKEISFGMRARLVNLWRPKEI
jgi:phosphohistidine phosphatase